MVLITKSSKEQDGYEGAQGGNPDGSEVSRPAPASDPIWRPAHRSRGKKRIRKTQTGFKMPPENLERRAYDAEGLRTGGGDPWRFYRTAADRAERFGSFAILSSPPERGRRFRGLRGPFGRGGHVYLRDGREGYRVLLTDVNLGDGISGWELARQIREITPDFPVLYMTSASAPDWESQGVGGSVLIAKPFAPAQLAAAVSQLLGSATSPD